MGDMEMENDEFRRDHPQFECHFKMIRPSNPTDHSPNLGIFRITFSESMTGLVTMRTLAKNINLENQRTARQVLNLKRDLIKKYLRIMGQFHIEKAGTAESNGWYVPQD